MGADRAKRKIRGGSIDKAWEDGVRAKIQASQIVNRLIGFVNGEITLEPAQVTTGLGLLRKVLPDLTYSESHNTHDHRFAEVPKTATDDEWDQILASRSGVPSQGRNLS